MRPYFCTIKVLLKKPIKATEETGDNHGFLVGYYRNIGVRAENVSEVLTLLKTIADDGTISVDQTLVYDFEKVEKEIADKYYENVGETVWYTSGRIYFPPNAEAN
jgi:hypothetical protein